MKSRPFGQFTISLLLMVIPVTLVLVALQATVIDRIEIAGVHPDLILVGVLLLTLISGRWTAAFAAIIMAPIYDAASGFPLGTSVLPLLSVVFLAGLGTRSLFGARLGWPIFIAIVATIIAGLITMAELALFGWTIPWSDTILRVVLPSAVLNAALVLILYAPIEFVQDRRTLLALK